MFALVKLEHLLNRNNPQVNTFVDKDALIAEDTHEFTSANEFMMALALERTTTNERLDDPHFVKWFAEHWTKKDGVMTKRAIPMHKCTNLDL